MSFFPSQQLAAKTSSHAVGVSSNSRFVDQRPSVCQVLHTLHVGGGELLARAYAQQNEAHFRPVFALLDAIGELGERLRDEGYVVEVMRRRPGFDWACAQRLKQFFRRQRVALVHAHQYGPLLYSALARSGWRRIPILFTEHGRDYPDFRRWKRVMANRVLLSGKDRFVAVGEYVRDAVVAYDGLPRGQVQVIYNGRNLADYALQRSLRATVRAELGLAPDSFAVIQVARLNRLKDHATALRAIAQLRVVIPQAQLILVGDGEERPHLENLTAELKLQDSVRFLGSREDVPRLLQSADVFLLTSISEGIPLTLIEAMATELPCVSTRVGGVPEVVVDGETGLLAESGDDRKIAHQLSLLARDSSMRAQMGRKGRVAVQKQFDASLMHSSYRVLYREMLCHQKIGSRFYAEASQ